MAVAAGSDGGNQIAPRSTNVSADPAPPVTATHHGGANRSRRGTRSRDYAHRLPLLMDPISQLDGPSTHTRHRSSKIG